MYTRATVAQLQKSLKVKMVRVTVNGLTSTAAGRNAPSLPDSISKNVQAIIGLQPFREALKQLVPHFPRPVELSSAHAVPTRPPGYLVKDILKAYNADALTVTGAGQRIAILIDRFPLRPDINYFWTQNGLPTDANRVNLINVKNVVLLLPDDGEESMDTEWTSGIAPGAKSRFTRVDHSSLWTWIWLWTGFWRMQ